ncbi:MAG: hypothetical protein L3K14_10015 [Thermoplasmata archaeon]|nr:hypothetical protein [Thermoplasmata archaeon]
MAGNLAASFPLFFFGAGCVVAATFVILEGHGAALGRIPLWLPFLALGTIALVGGTLSVFAEPDHPIENGSIERNLPTPVRPVSYSPPAVPPGQFKPPRVDSVVKRQELPRPRPQRSPVRARGMASSPPPETTAGAPAPPVPPDDVGALLKEIDRIEADLHSSGAASEAAPSTPSLPETSVPSVEPPSTNSSRVESRPTDSRPSNDPLDDLESEAPGKIATCGGCGSVIIDEGTISQCQVCGEPLCSECRDRSRSEGTPNVCPLCSLLDTIHSGAPTSARPSAQRT